MKQVTIRHLRDNQRGFTLLELMIATTIFSSILLLLTFGLINIGKSYYKGRNTARTQELARRVMDEISQSIRFGDRAPSPITNYNGVDYVLGKGVIRDSTDPGNIINIDPADVRSHLFEDYNPTNITIEDYFCIGNKRYVFGNKRVKEAEGADTAQHGLVVDTVGECKVDGGGLKQNLASGRKELLALNARLTEFKIVKNGGNYTITVQVTTGDDGLVVLRKPTNPTDPPYGSCKGGTDSPYCAVSRLETTVQRRRNN